MAIKAEKAAQRFLAMAQAVLTAGVAGRADIERPVEVAGVHAGSAGKTPSAAVPIGQGVFSVDWHSQRPLQAADAVHLGGCVGGDVRHSASSVADGAPAQPRPGLEAARHRVAEPPLPRVLAAFAPAEAVRGERRLSRGAERLWTYLHRLALDVARERAYLELVSQVVYHCPAVTLAGLLGVTDRHLRRLAGELEAVGLLDCGGHAQNVAGRSLYDGTLWAVQTIPGGEPPRLRAVDWKHVWRPDFVADVQGKTGAALEMSELQTQEADTEEKYGAAKRRAAVPDGKYPPPLSSSDISARPCLRAVVDGLATLAGVHASKRAGMVGALASQIAAALSEADRRRYWCRVIWEALRAENEQRAGLQVLAAQLGRLQADLDEGAPWKNPGAVLAARLKVA